MNYADQMLVGLLRLKGLPACCTGKASLQSLLLGAGFFLSLGTLLLGVVPSSRASLEVLSDMDCVVEPSAMVELGSAVPGLIAESFYDRSDFVSHGTVMARLESEVERVSLAIAEQVAGSSTAVQLRELTAGFGQRTRDRNEELLKTSGVSRQVVDQVSTEARIASLQVEQERESQRLAALEVARARALLDRREIRAPISGAVVQRYKRIGEYVDSEPVYQIAQLDPLHVEVIVPVEYMGNLTAGMNAAISIALPQFENNLLSAVVRRIDAVADAASATYGVRLVLDNPDLSIPSGVRCQVDFLAS
ncbi:MAG: efflux RND transporter periplasmic adaptor subunit [Granulosicoccus sp.]|nr:efflux RND transporter periplasmic adaptor subunit [Granulosicoccus sp.]